MTELSWLVFKEFVTDKGLKLQYFDTGDLYFIWTTSGEIGFQCRIKKDSGSDQTDFETNFQGTANQAIVDPLLGALTETAPASDTASSGLNGRLQRIAQRLTSLIAATPASLTDTQLRATPVPISGTVTTAPGAATAVTYSASIVNLAVVTGATDFFTLTGSASKTIKITSITISGSAAAAVVVPVLVIRRSAANTAGTSTTPTVVPYDSTFAAGTAVARAYTTNPSALGAVVGTIYTQKIGLPLTSGPTPVVVNADFGPSFAAPIVLRGTAELLALNLNATAVTTASMNITIEWIEV